MTEIVPEPAGETFWTVVSTGRNGSVTEAGPFPTLDAALAHFAEIPEQVKSKGRNVQVFRTDKVQEDVNVDVTDEAETDYDAYSKDELHDLAAARDLPVSGTKQDLIDRLREDDASTSPTEV